MVRTVSQKRVRGNEGDEFIGRMARAIDQNRVNESEMDLYDALLGRGTWVQSPRRQTLSERDGDWN